jgi:DNA-binding IclR family transcriptional regulator
LNTNPASSSAARFRQRPQNRSLERGIEILRAFKPGADILGNGDLAERTGLPPATVSRLTQTLVGTGMLEHDSRHRAYRLAAPVLSLAHAMRSGSPVLQLAAPMMRKLAEKMKINVGLAVADRDEMVYLESVRYNRRVSLRNVVAGQRVPIELTSLGRAWLAAATVSRRRELLALFKSRRPASWRSLEKEILDAIEQVATSGFCAASWQPEVVALATPIAVAGHPVYVLNLSVTGSGIREATQRLHAPLLQLAAGLRDAIGAL